MRKAEIFVHETRAGLLTEDDTGYFFRYNKEYLQSNNPSPVSLTLPLTDTPFHSKSLFPAFDGLIPEGWLLTIAERNWKINPRDRMGLLMVCCRDCIGVLSVRTCEDNNDDQ